MSTQTIIVIIAVVMIVAIAAAGLRRAGPRVTEVDRVVRREKEESE
jgi:hypothetical protein